MTPYWLASAKENREQGPSVGSSSNLTQPQSDHVVMKNSVSIAGGSHEYKALPIVPVKVKGRGNGEIITTYALLDNGQHQPGAVRVWPRS